MPRPQRNRKKTQRYGFDNPKPKPKTKAKRKPKTKSTKSKAKAKKTEPKKNTAVPFNKRKEYVPVNKMMLPHSINGRHVFLTQFKGTDYDLNEVRDFVGKLKTEFEKSGEVHNLQIGFGFDSGKHYTNKWSNIGDDLVIQDFRGMYQDVGKISSFNIIIS